MSATEPVNIRVLDREYTIGVEPAERESLMAAARMLDSKMREVRGSNRMAAVDRIAVLAALNLAHELQQLRQQEESAGKDAGALLESLQRTLDGAIEATRA